ncbi:MAG: GNAT family N-acetyltransferase [bacterium]
MREIYSEQLPYTEIIIDDQITLRQLSHSEADVFFQLVDNDRGYLRKWLPWVDSTKNSKDSLDFINSVIQKRRAGEEYGFAVVVDDKPVGHISLMHIKDGSEPEIGYWIASKMSGKGITSKAGIALTDFGFYNLGLKRIIIKADPENTASNKVAEKLGYELTRQYDDDVDGPTNVWTLNRPD